jgi:hypothetical protein
LMDSGLGLLPTPRPADGGRARAGPLRVVRRGRRACPRCRRRR